MTIREEHEGKVRLALSELEESLDWFDNDEAFVLFVQFEAKLLEVLR